VKVEEFGFGYPPRAWGRKKGETTYSLNWIPFGGFVRLLGENEEVDDPRSFNAQKWWVRSLIALAGIFNNFVLALLIYGLLFLVTGIPRQTDQVRIEGVEPDSPAAQIGFLAGDYLVSVNEKRFESADEFVDFVMGAKGEELEIVVEREGEQQLFLVTGRQEVEEGQGSLGVVVSSYELYRPVFWKAPFIAFYHGAVQTLKMTKLIMGGMGTLFKSIFLQGQVPKDIAGPIGILQITHQVTQFGLIAILEFMAMLSINLGLVNFLPIPGLDGGRFLFILGTQVFRGRSMKKIELMANQVGFLLLVGLMFAITFNDLKRVVETTAFGQRIQAFWPF
ncbi:RIP metalloprotease, partial [Patescibacteria group bacterium]|nr:RIP metalloprotease [Patescibacteria group bacterium]